MIEDEMKPLNTAMLFQDTSRENVPMRRKADDQLNYIGPEVGVGPNGLALPKGAVAGVALEAVLRRLTVRQRDSDFDKLPIRFRAVATDVTTAEMVVLDHGSLATAVRASMAIPAVRQSGGARRPLAGRRWRHAQPAGRRRALARCAGGDRSQHRHAAARAQAITSLLSISDQLTRMLTNTNVSQSLKELGPDDVLITPDLGTVGTADFERLLEAAAAGEKAARGVVAQLAKLQVDPDDIRCRDGGAHRAGVCRRGAHRGGGSEGRLARQPGGGEWRDAIGSWRYLSMPRWPTATCAHLWQRRLRAGQLLPDRTTRRRPRADRRCDREVVGAQLPALRHQPVHRLRGQFLLQPAGHAPLDLAQLARRRMAQRPADRQQRAPAHRVAPAAVAGAAMVHGRRRRIRQRPLRHLRRWPTDLALPAQHRADGSGRGRALRARWRSAPGRLARPRQAR